MKVVGNLKELIGEAAAGYISLNAEDFRSMTPGPKGDDGLQGEQGVGIHHLKGTSTTDSEGDFATGGEDDTYTFYGDPNETLNLGHFVVHNGKDAYRYAVDGGYAESETEFYLDLGIIGNVSESVSEAADQVAEDRLAVHSDALQVAADRIVVESARDVTVAAKDITVTSANEVQQIFLGEKTSDPVVDNQGNPLQVGVMYYNSMSETLRIWNGTKWNLGAFSAAGAVVSVNGRDGAVEIVNNDITVAVGKNLTDAIKYSESDKVLTDVNRIAISTDTAIVAGLGDIVWNQDEGTLDVGLVNATLQVGQEELVRVRADATITNGRVVMVNGSVGNSGRIKVVHHDGTIANGKRVLGIATEDIALGADGFVTVRGKVRGIDTTGAVVGEVWEDGDPLYIKPNDGGVLTKIVPSDDQLLMPVAYVVHAHSNGTLYVRVNGVDENATKVWAMARYETIKEW